MLSVVRFVLVVIEVLSALLLLGVILIQKTRGTGMGLAFGSGMGESLFGAQMGNVLTKTTVVLGIVFLVNTTLLAVIGGRAGPRSVTSVVPAAPIPTQSAGGPVGAPDMPAPVTDLPAE